MTRKEATRRAYSDLVNRVFVHIRNGIGKDHPDRDSILHDLGDAMHNVSVMLQEEDGWIDDVGYRSIYLSIFDKKWAGEMNLYLSDFIDYKVAEYLDENSSRNT